MRKYAVILFNLGGPDSLDSVEPFLHNLFCDSDIIKIPVGQKIFARLISKVREEKVKAKYEQIGGKSPINKWTEIQRSMLKNELMKEFEHIEVYTAMRYWHPMIRDVAQTVSSADFDKIVLLPLYPHYSVTTTGSSFNEWQRYYRGDKQRLVFIHGYEEHAAYISALNNRIDETMMLFPEKVRKKVQLVFSAHGTPLSLVKKGDPYSHDIKQTVMHLMALRRYSHEYHLCYQSKIGFVKWLEPATHRVIEDLGRKNKKNIMVIPISFVSDHIETLHELDIEYREIANKAHLENYFVMKGLNDSIDFCMALKEITMSALHLEASKGKAIQ